jgi:hypothetical protein
MTTQSGSINARKIPTSYICKKHFESGGYYLSSITGFSTEEHFLWGRVYPTAYPTWTTTFSQYVPPTTTVTMTVALLGGISASSVNPDHHIIVTLNGTQIGDIKFDGKTYTTVQMTVPGSVFATYPATNTLVFYGPMDLGLAYELVYIDWFELEFNNTYTAASNLLEFSYSTTGSWKYQVGGFSSDQIKVFDVTNPLTPVQITGVVISGTGTYTAEFQDEVINSTRYWAGATSQLKSVTSIEQDTPSTLHASTNSADYIIITHTAFTNAANTLRTYREANGLRSVAVDVQDVYDEFSYGIIEATAIRDFLAFAYSNWVRPAPAYVVLFGDGNYDPKNYLKFNRTSYIPPYLLPVDPWIQETAGDNRYVTLSGNDVMPDMMLGRLAVNSAAEADTVVAKIIAYEHNSASSDWRRQFLAVADNADAAGYYNVISDNLINCCVPTTVTPTRVYYGVTHTDIPSARSAVLAGYGKYIVNYIGHGYSTGWASESLLSISSIPSMSNGVQQPIALVMACLEGYYINPSSAQDSLAEVAARAVNKGSIASWSATGQGDAGGHDYLNRGFLNAVYSNGAQTVGVATQAGKQALFAIGASPDLLDTYLLFGDPALRLNPLPTAVDLISFDAVYKKKSVILNWETASELDTVGFNIYRSRTIDGVKKKINPEIIAALKPGMPAGAFYTFIDTTVKADRKYFYWLESLDINNESDLHGPVKVKTVKK